jgi:colicin import membrane protein
MIRWLTALFFSIAVHLGILFGYSAFTLESNEPLKRKITNVNFVESEIDEKDEIKKPKTTNPKTKTKKKDQAIKEPQEKIKEIENLDEYLKEEELKKENDYKLGIVEQISSKVIKDIEGLWVRPNNISNGMFVDFNLKLNRIGIIESIELKKSSGNQTFDRAALTAIRKYRQVKYIRNIDDETFRAYFADFTLRFKPE